MPVCRSGSGQFVWRAAETGPRFTDDSSGSLSRGDVAQPRALGRRGGALDRTSASRSGGSREPLGAVDLALDEKRSSGRRERVSPQGLTTDPSRRRISLPDCPRATSTSPARGPRCGIARGQLWRLRRRNTYLPYTYRVKDSCHAPGLTSSLAVSSVLQRRSGGVRKCSPQAAERRGP